MDESLTTMVLTIMIALFLMILCSCFVCLYIRISDLKLKIYVMEMAKKKGITIEMEDLNPECPGCQLPLTKENCTVIIPDVGIII